MFFKVLKVPRVKECRSFLSQKGSPRDPRGDQKGAKKSPKSEKMIFQNWLFYLSKTIDFETRGGQKAPQGTPKTKSKIEEKTKTKKEGKMVTKSGHAADLTTGKGAIIDPRGPRGRQDQRLLIKTIYQTRDYGKRALSVIEVVVNAQANRR